MEQDQSTKNAVENNDSKQEKEKNISKIDETDSNKEDNFEEQQIENQAVNRDPRYEKYLKMIHFGVPKEAVKLKMEQEGLDSSILE